MKTEAVYLNSGSQDVEPGSLEVVQSVTPPEGAIDLVGWQFGVDGDGIEGPVRVAVQLQEVLDPGDPEAAPPVPPVTATINHFVYRGGHGRPLQGSPILLGSGYDLEEQFQVQYRFRNDGPGTVQLRASATLWFRVEE